MGGLHRVATLDQASLSYVTGICDFAVYDASGGAVLYSVGGAANGLTAFELHQGSGAVLLDQQSLPARGGLAPLDLSVLSFGAQSVLWVEPWLASGFQAYGLSPGGEIGAALSYSGQAVLAAGLVQATVFATASGSAVYGGLFGQTGLVRLDLNASGAAQGASLLGGTGAEDAAALTGGQIGGQDFLFSARLGDAAVTSWEVGATGGLTERASLGAADGIGIATPTALEFVTYGANSFLVLAAAGSNSLSVFAVDAAGGLSLRDHITDTGYTRFAGVSALDVIQHQGRVFVLAGGADDGISLFQMLPDGRLVHLETRADGFDTTLRHVSAVGMVALGDEIQVFVAGVENGVTQFVLDPGPAGVSTGGTGGGNNDLLLAGAGTQTLNGRDGDDILVDAAGSTRMTGGAGADIFVLSPDEAVDYILDFNPDEDRLDLTAYPMLRNLGQIRFITRPDGIELRIGDDRLVITSADHTPLDPGKFTVAGLLPVDRIPLYDLPTLPGGVELAGNGGADTLTGTEYDDLLAGKGGRDLLYGLGGDDQVFGDGGQDQLYGDAGNDSLLGGDDKDRLYGGDGADSLLGGEGKDRLYGGSGNDSLVGGGGKDMLVGGGGADRFLFNRLDGKDKIRDFNPGQDQLWLDPALWGGGLDAAEVLESYGRIRKHNLVLNFGDGDKLVLKGIDDWHLIEDDIHFL